jgi:hypothetical protein
MRYLTSLLLLIIGCTDSSSIDPSDPLIGMWERASAKGEHGSPSFPRWSFGAGGNYQLETAQLSPNGEVVIVPLESGVWERVDADTISRCKHPCEASIQSPVRIEDDGMLIDEQLAMNGSWRWESMGFCVQHGQMVPVWSWVELRWDGYAERAREYCTGAPTPSVERCTGTWTSRPRGLTATLTNFCTATLDFFRAGDMVADTGFIRVTEP